MGERISGNGLYDYESLEPIGATGAFRARRRGYDCSIELHKDGRPAGRLWEIDKLCLQERERLSLGAYTHEDTTKDLGVATLLTKLMKPDMADFKNLMEEKMEDLSHQAAAMGIDIAALVAARRTELYRESAEGNRRQIAAVAGRLATNSETYWVRTDMGRRRDATVSEFGIAPICGLTIVANEIKKVRYVDPVVRTVDGELAAVPAGLNFSLRVNQPALYRA